MATPYPFFTATDSNIHRQGLNSAAVHGVVKRHASGASHPRAVEPGLLVVFTRVWRLNVDIWAITLEKGDINALIYEIKIRWELNGNGHQVDFANTAASKNNNNTDL